MWKTYELKTYYGTIYIGGVCKNSHTSSPLLLLCAQRIDSPAAWLTSERVTIQDIGDRASKLWSPLPTGLSHNALSK